MNHTIAGNIAVGAPGSSARAMANREHFQNALEAQYRHLFATDPDYAHSAEAITPEALAEKVTGFFVRGCSASKDGKAIKAVCKQFRIPHTYKAIKAYLAGNDEGVKL